MIAQEILVELLKLPLWHRKAIPVSEKNMKVQVVEEHHGFKIVLHFACEQLHAPILNELAEIYPKLEFSIEQKVMSHLTHAQLPHRSEIKNIIAVASGKGGVGKSMVAVNLALALQAEGAKVGILDADIYGPSLPTLLKLNEVPESKDGKSLEPYISYGLQAMSIGCLLHEKDTAMIWRGPMASTALQQLFRDCQWHDLDYLIIDLPPGTGDIQLTLAQKIPVTGVIVVTTPQDIALLDVQKAYRMFEKVNIPVVGIIENMSVYVCEKCGHEAHLFGEGGAEKMSASYHLPVLGALPLMAAVRKDCDEGEPTLVRSPKEKISATFKEIAMRVSAHLANLPVYKPNKIPKIVVETK